MRHRWRRGFLAVVVGLLVAGCFGPQSPMFGDGESVPEEASRVPLPVRPGPDGTWALNVPVPGLLGQGRTLVRLADAKNLSGTQDAGWRLNLPAEFALTSHQPGAAHSAFVRAGQVVLVGGRDGRDGPSAIAGLDAAQGRVTWQHALPPGSRVFQFENAFEVLAAVCRPTSCRLSGWDAWSGELRWTRTVAGAVRVVDACRFGAPVFSDDRSRVSCGFRLVTPDRVGTVAPEDGRLSWQAGLRPPGGTVDRVIEDGDRLIMVTAPAKGSCRATVLAGGVTSGDGDTGWRYSFVWDQPQAPRDARTGCRWDRTLPLFVGFNLVLPDAEGALVAIPYFGTLRPTRRLAPGEYLFTDGPLRDIVRAPGRPDRLLPPAADGPVRPHGLSPAARSVTDGFWQDGRRLLLLDHEGHTLWKGTSGCRAFVHSARDGGGRLTYCDGHDLVTVRPGHKD
ncbi:outer membrane protein assembly factor BamB family protein [Streptomyces sp. NPDC002308]